MHREVGLGLACAALFGLGLHHAAQVGRERDAARIAALESELAALRRRVDSANGPATLDDVASASGFVRESPAGAGVPAAAGAVKATDASAAQPDSGLTDTSARPAPQRNPAFPAPSRDLLLAQARALLDGDAARGIASVERIVESTRGRSSSLRTALDAIALLEPVNDRQADEALLRFARSDSALIRLQAGKVLARRGDGEPVARAVEQLTAELDSPDHRQRLQALALLGFAAERSAIPEILPLLHDENSEIRGRAARTLGRFADPSLAARVEPLLQDPVPRVRAQAQQALARMQ